MIAPNRALQPCDGERSTGRSATLTGAVQAGRGRTGVRGRGEHRRCGRTSAKPQGERGRALGGRSHEAPDKPDQRGTEGCPVHEQRRSVSRRDHDDRSVGSRSSTKTIT